MEEKRNTRIILLIIFVAMLALPVATWPIVRNFVNTENQENRKYAELPEFSIKNAQNITSGLEAWFNDRVPYKNQVANLTSELKLVFNSQSSWLNYYSGSRVIVGKDDDWLYYNGTEGESTIEDYMGGNLYTEEELEELAAGYQKLADQYETVGTKLILFIPPNKEQVYPEFMPESLGEITDYSRMDQFVAYMREHVDFPVIYAKDALLAAKEEGYRVFLKYDSHWNYLGAFIGTQLLSQAILGESETLSEHQIVQLLDADGEPVPEDRDLARMLGLGERYTEYENLTVLDYKVDVYSHMGYWYGPDNATYINWKSYAPDQSSVLLFHDSFAYNMEEFMSRDYGDLMLLEEPKYARQYVLDTPPDYAVLEIVERKKETLDTVWQELLLYEE